MTNTIYSFNRRSRERRFVALLFGLCALLCLVGEVCAEPTEFNHFTHGSLVLDDSSGNNAAKSTVPLIDTDVAMTINAMIARVTVKQTFQHQGDRWVNAIYAFPLPETAAVDHLRMRIGERTLEGEIQTRQKARQQYEDARDKGRKASLIEQQRPNLFTTRVANLGPRETVEVEIEYQQTLDYRDGWFSLRFPMTVGVRYIPGSRPVAGFDGGGWSYNTDQVPDASLITPPMTIAGEGYNNPVRLSVVLEAGMPLAAIESPYHAITTQRLSESRYDIALAPGPVPADRDFELRFRPRAGSEPKAAFFRQRGDAADYGLLMLVPPEVEWARNTAQARELIFVVDTSGSMHGTSIRQARDALKFGLTRLRPADSFNIVQFNSSTHQMSSSALPATGENLRRATQYIDRLRADGGTEMAAALDLVLDGAETHPRLKQVVFITDGSVGNEAGLFEIIDRRLGAARLFTVGIGSAPNAYFMREAAAVGRGTYTYVGAVDEVGSRMSQLFEKLEFPVLTHLEVTSDGDAEFAPVPLPDLHIHEPLVMNMVLNTASRITLSGRFNGQDWSTTVPVEGGGNAVGLNVAWARQKIADLERSIARGARRTEVNQAIEDLGLTHHLVTSRTSLIAVDTTPSRPAEAVVQDKLVPNKLPAGWTMPLGAARLPQTATPMILNLLLGLLSLIGCVSLRLRWWS